MKNYLRALTLKWNRFKRRSQAPVPSIISASTKLKGDILNADILQIDGKLEGDIHCTELIIGLNGQVQGKVYAKNLSIYGSLNGHAEADVMFIASSARMVGNVLHKSLAIEPGAYIEGNCIHTPRADNGAKAVVTPLHAVNGLNK